MILIGILSFLIFILVVRHKTWKALPWPEGAVKPSLFQAHRGTWTGGIQENTLDSFRQAKLLGFEMFELDVQLSLDRIPVIFHDRDLQRLRNRSEWASHLNAADLKTIATVSQLEEILTDAQVPSKVNIELKSDSFFDNGLESLVAGVVKKCGAEKRVLFSSFNPLSLSRLRRHLPDVPRALLATQDPDPKNKIYLKQMWFAPYVGVHLLHLDYRYVTSADLQYWKKRGVPIALWTVNEQKKAQEFLDAGALSIITDQKLF